MTLSISDDGTLGQTPTEYLAPVFRRMGATRGQAVTTRFTKRLIRGGKISPVSFSVPNTKAKLANTRKWRISKGQYAQILAALGVNEYAKGGGKKVTDTLQSTAPAAAAAAARSNREYIGQR